MKQKKPRSSEKKTAVATLFTRPHCVRTHDVTYQLCHALRAFFCSPLCVRIVDTAESCIERFFVFP